MHLRGSMRRQVSFVLGLPDILHLPGRPDRRFKSYRAVCTGVHTHDDLSRHEDEPTVPIRRGALLQACTGKSPKFNTCLVPFPFQGDSPLRD